MAKICRIALLLLLITSTFSQESEADLLLEFASGKAVMQAGEFLDGIVYSTADSVFHTSGQSSKLILENASHPPLLAEDDGSVTLWIATGEDIYEWRNGQDYAQLRFSDFIPSKDGRSSSRMTALDVFGGFLWIGVYGDGIYKIDIESEAVELVYRKRADVKHLKVSAQGIWGRDHHGLYLSDAGKNLVYRELLGADDSYVISEVTKIEDTFWITTADKVAENPGPVYIFRNGSFVEIDGSKNQGIVSVAANGDGVSASSILGLYHFKDGLQRPFVRDTSFPRIPINAAGNIEGHLWLLFEKGIFKRLESGKFKLLPEDGLGSPVPSELTLEEISRPFFDFRGALRAGDMLWVWGDSGLYYVEEDYEIDIDMPTFMRFNLGESLWLRDPGYFRIDGAGRLEDERDFFAVVKSSKSELERAIKNNEFTSLSEKTSYDFPYGVRDVFVAVRDDLGNTRYLVLDSRIVFPFSVFLALLASLLGTGLLIVFSKGVVNWAVTLGSFFLSRRYLVPMSIVNEKFRKGSSGCLPFLLVFPGRRAYLLRRYLENLCEELKGFCESNGVASHDYPSRDECLKRLASHRKIQVTGKESDRGMFLRLLAMQLACGGAKRPAYVPVLIEVNNYLNKSESDPERSDIQRSVLGKLANFGDINDVGLGNNLLDHGGFAFFLDGIERLDERGRAAVMQFFDKYSRENLFIFGADEIVSDKFGPLFKCPDARGKSDED